MIYRCGYRYCGGCNPRYDRKKLVKEVKNKIESNFLKSLEENQNNAKQKEESTVIFEYADYVNEYDSLIIIGGCSSCCASYDELKVKGKILKIRDEKEKEKIVSLILEDKNGLEKIL